MASIFKRSYTKTDPKTGEKVSRKTRKWYGEYRDANGVLQRVPLCTDKKAAQAMLNELVVKAERRQSGLSDPYEAHRRRPIGEHVENYRRHLYAKGNSSQHLKDTISRINAIIEGCQFKYLPDLAAGKVADYLANRRAEGLSITSANHYLTAVKGFSRWLVRDQRKANNPLAHLSRLNADTDIRVERRALSAEEFGKLISAALASETKFRGLTGRDRAMLYTVAGYSGFRASELASMALTSFDLDGKPPTVTVEAGYTKRKRRDKQPLPPWLAEQLRLWLAARPEEKTKIWPGRWPEKAAKMLRGDLEAAEIPYTDEMGRVFDFHSLRHQFISSLATAGVHPKVAQQLARHSTITLTLDRYTHLALGEVAGALDQLPIVPLEGVPKQSQETAAPKLNPPPKQAVRLAVGLAVPGAFSCPKSTAPDRRGGAWPTDQETKKPLAEKGFASIWPLVSEADQVRLLGLEPKTYGLKVRCSAN